MSNQKKKSILKEDMQILKGKEKKEIFIKAATLSQVLIEEQEFKENKPRMAESVLLTILFLRRQQYQAQNKHFNNYF